MIGFYQVPSATDLNQYIDADSVTGTDFIWAAVVVGLAFLAARLLRTLLRSVLRRVPRLTDEAVLLISRAAGWILILIGIVYALAIIGVDLGPALMVIIILAVVLFFAGRGIIENFAAGLVLQGTPMFAVGDQIMTVSGTGTVREITGRTVAIVSPDGEEIYIPNKTVIADPTVNLTNLGSRRSTIDILVVYGTDLDRAKTFIEEATAGCDSAHSEPPPEALVSKLGDDGIEFKLWFWHDPTIIAGFRATDEVSRSVVRVLGERGVEFAFPQRTLWWGDRAGLPEAPER